MLDEIIQDFNEWVNEEKNGRIKWNSFNNKSLKSFEYYYAENELYVIRHKELQSLQFVYARSPREAIEKVFAGILKRRFKGEKIINQHAKTIINAEKIDFLN